MPTAYSLTAARHVATSGRPVITVTNQAGSFWPTIQMEESSRQGSAGFIYLLDEPFHLRGRLGVGLEPFKGPGHVRTRGQRWLGNERCGDFTELGDFRRHAAFRRAKELRRLAVEVGGSGAGSHVVTLAV